jgi:hypothetical protein
MITRKPSGPYLIESSPHYGKRRACLALRRLAILPISIMCAVVTGYRDELRHMQDASAVYLGPGK